MTGPDGVPVRSAAAEAIGVAAHEGRPTHDELVAAVAALLAARGRGAAARPAAPDAWRRRRLAAVGLAVRRRP